MTDKEKIELIIKDKQLNNTQFCNEVCIAPGTLSHIRSGRTEPTLNILRSISQAFPDINPAWLFYGEGAMYKTDSPTAEPDAGATSADYDAETAASYDFSGDLFSQAAPGTYPGTVTNAVPSPDAAAAQLEAAKSRGSDTTIPRNPKTPSAYQGSPANQALSARQTSMLHQAPSARQAQSAHQGSPLSSLQSPLNVQDIVVETLRQQQKPPRKVIEVRIFFDDGTFETFSSK